MTRDRAMPYASPTVCLHGSPCWFNVLHGIDVPVWNHAHRLQAGRACGRAVSGEQAVFRTHAYRRCATRRRAPAAVLSGKRIGNRAADGCGFIRSERNGFDCAHSARAPEDSVALATFPPRMPEGATRAVLSSSAPRVSRTTTPASRAHCGTCAATATRPASRPAPS